MTIRTLVVTIVHLIFGIVFLFISVPKPKIDIKNPCLIRTITIVEITKNIVIPKLVIV